MIPDNYCELAKRTECDHLAALKRLSGGMGTVPETVSDISDKVLATKLNHGIIGLMGEVGELASILEKWIYYQSGEGVDVKHIYEELGDCMWYIALICNTLGLSLEKVMTSNIAKLRARYPDKYKDVLALEKNRNREKEREAITSVTERPSVES